MSLFGACKQADIFLVIEEGGKAPNACSQHDFDQILIDSAIADGAIVTKVTIMDRWAVSSKKVLLRENGTVNGSGGTHA